ncbi:TPA: glycosyltransferase family 2 protein [Klebsiella pneumoniae]|nr:glycosyltransferase [Klebsiella pneumoniae]HBR9964444.1 glycosyltransferase family 2 protein [Klebsiella pneumoniae]HBX5186930.1 glycosyltransferase [Klebsiella pneumoniae]
MNSNFENCSVDVICPVYNKAHLIDGFITSFLNKLPKSNFNLILINDGSSDNLEEVISKYAHDNIQLYNKENGGVSSARNMGLTISKAEYVWFCDPDDEIIANGEDIIKLLYKEKADIYVFAYKESKLDSKKIYVKKIKPITNIILVIICYNMITSGLIMGSVHYGIRYIKDVYSKSITSMSTYQMPKIECST